MHAQYETTLPTIVKPLDKYLFEQLSEQVEERKNFLLVNKIDGSKLFSSLIR